MSEKIINEMLEDDRGRYVPSRIVTREGKFLDTSGDVWNLPYSLRDSTTLNFSRILNEDLKVALKLYISERIQRISTHAGYSVFSEVCRHVLKNEVQEHLKSNELTEKVISLMETVITKLRADHKLWAIYRTVQWYIYSAENYPELGFCPAYALELEGMVIPGNPKGEAVRLEDIDQGPLHHSKELPLLIHVLKNDKSQNLEHLQQKAALALSIAYGRNPANLTFLREEDFVDITPKTETRCYVLRIPRIKKRQLSARDDFIEEYVEPAFAGFITDLIAKNALTEVSLILNGKPIANPRPLFVKQQGNRAALESHDLENAYSMASADITLLLKGFVKRHNIISPVTKELMRVNARRLRYTLATGLAAEGISKRELARILDHTDTQHVLVYFEMAGQIVEHLDKAAAKNLASYLKFFSGTVVETAEQALNGEKEDKHIFYIDEDKPLEQVEAGVCGEQNICHLDPPFSCYLCPKFQPYKHADHELILKSLLQNREKRINQYESARLGVQLDDVIVAVSQVAELCSKDHKNG